jgi:hypothetical protein
MYHNSGFASFRRPEIIVNSNDSIWSSALGAFFGAFAAFIFGLIAFYLQKKFERYWKHKNSVVEIEHLLQDHLDQSAANQFLLNGAIETLQRHHMTYTLLTQLRLSEDINLRVGDLELLNKYFDYKEPVVKVNHGMKTWEGMNTQLHQTIISNPTLPAPIVHQNMNHLKEQAQSLLKFMAALDKDTEYLLGYVRVYMRKDKHIWSLWLHKKRYSDAEFVSEDEIQSEIKILESEIREISEKSKERIQKIVNG